MKKERNCSGGTPYPVYPMYNMPGPLPVGGVNMPMPMPMSMPNYTNYSTTNYSSNDLNTLNNKVNSLEQRVSNLENMINNSYSNNYNSNNYQMM